MRRRGSRALTNSALRWSRMKVPKVTICLYPRKKVVDLPCPRIAGPRWHALRMSQIGQVRSVAAGRLADSNTA